MTSLCKYKDVFGKPGKDFHKLRIGGVAAGDFGLTFMLAWFTSWLSKKYSNEIPLTITLIFWLILSIIVHALFCVNTSVNKFLKI